MQSQHNDLFDRYVIKRGYESAPYYDANRYFRNYPDKDRNYSGEVTLSKRMAKGRVSGDFLIKYGFTRTNEKRTSELYMLNQISGYDDFGILPSASEYLPTFSPNDSYASYLKVNRHTITPSLEFGKLRTSSALFTVFAGIPFDVYNREFHYDGRGVNSNLSRNDFAVGAYMSANCHLPKKLMLNFSLSTTENTVPMLSLVEMQNSTDPLNIYLGNPNLQNSRTSNVTLQATKQKRMLKHTMEIQGLVISNAISRGYIYNPSDGVRTYRMYNVDGNWNAKGYYNFFTPFGPSSQFNISTTLNGEYRHSVDLAGTSTTDATATPPRQTVNTVTAA